MICKICGRECSNFKSLSMHIIRNHFDWPIKKYYDTYLIKKENQEGICKQCGKETIFTGLRGYQKFCSPKCSANNQDTRKKCEKTNLDRHSFRNPSQCLEFKKKKEETNLKHCGYKYNMQSLESQKKYKETVMKHYNVKYPLQSKEIYSKYKNKMIQNHSVEYPLQSKEIQKKFKQTCIKKYGSENPSQSKIIQEKCKTTSKKNCGFNYWSQTPQGKQKCRELAGLNMIKNIRLNLKDNQKFSPIKGKNEKIVFNELQNYCFYPLLEDHQIGHLFPDRLVKELKLIIELDEKEHLRECGKKRDKIRDDFFKFKGYNIFHIIEKEWFENKQKIINEFKHFIKELENGIISRSTRCL